MNKFHMQAYTSKFKQSFALVTRGCICTFFLLYYNFNISLWTTQSLEAASACKLSVNITTIYTASYHTALNLHRRINLEFDSPSHGLRKW